MKFKLYIRTSIRILLVFLVVLMIYPIVCILLNLGSGFLSNLIDSVMMLSGVCPVFFYVSLLFSIISNRKNLRCMLSHNNGLGTFLFLSTFTEIVAYQAGALSIKYLIAENVIALMLAFVIISVSFFEEGGPKGNDLFIEKQEESHKTYKK